MVDSYMRSFGRICVSEIQDGGIIAKRLEALLNKQIAISDPSKQAAFNPEKTGGRPLADYETVDPGVLAQPEFQFMPAGWKIAKIEEYHRMRRELEKTKETREMLESADHGDSGMQRRLLNNSDEFKTIIEHLDADPKTVAEHGKFGDLWYLDRMRKVQGSVDGLIGKIVSEDLYLIAIIVQIY